MELMKSTKPHLYPTLLAACLLGLSSFDGRAQSPSALYTWDDTGNAAPNVEQWYRNFGAASTSATLDNLTFGELRIIETSTALGGSQAFTDNGNRVRESFSATGGGTDLTGLSYLEFDLGHNGAGPINVQFFVQASTAYSFVALGPDLAVAPGMNTYQVPLTGLTPAQAVYVRTMGFNARDHAVLGNVTWTLGEVRSVGQTLTSRTLVSHDTGTSDAGLQGAIVNFDRAAVQGNDGGANQTGLSHNAAGSGSLQWVDLANQGGGAITWGNGTVWNGNSFNERLTDLSNYEKMIIRMSAEEVNPDGGGTLDVQGFFQKNGYQYSAAGTLSLPIDGVFHDLEFSLAELPNMDVVEWTGVNLADHATDLRINVDNILFLIPEPTVTSLLGLGVGIVLFLRGRRARSAKV